LTSTALKKFELHRFLPRLFCDTAPEKIKRKKFGCITSGFWREFIYDGAKYVGLWRCRRRKMFWHTGVVCMGDLWIGWFNFYNSVSFFATENCKVHLIFYNLLQSTKNQSSKVWMRCVHFSEPINFLSLSIGFSGLKDWSPADYAVKMQICGAVKSNLQALI